MKNKFLLFKGRLFYIFLLILLQVIVLYAFISWTSMIMPLNFVLPIISGVMTFYLLSKFANPSYKMIWIIIIFILPVFGILLYFLFGSKTAGKAVYKEFKHAAEISSRILKQDNHVLGSLKTKSQSAARQAEYIMNTTGLALYQDTTTEYFGSGEEFFERLIEELGKAEKFIFMEYFLIEEGVMWNSILEILKKKAANGLDVRLIYDDFGCMDTLPINYNKKLEKMGIKCAVFNPMIPFIAMRQINNRDHRKVCVIDSSIGFTGGINLADEYINAVNKFGHWVDNGILLKGLAVKNLLVSFLAVWNFVRKDTVTVDFYLDRCRCFADEGYVLPYTDNPYFYEDVSINVYINMIAKAKEYIYISTPYFVLDFALQQALITTAKSGVDVRICLPGIPDKKIAYLLAQSYFKSLTEAGVKIYLYTPGFVHAKTFVSDDETAIIGTINMNFRSLFLDFENAVWMYRTDAVMQLKESYLKRLAKCKLVTIEDIINTPWYKRLFYTLLKPLSPLL